MSRIITFRGQLAMGVQERLSLHTLTGEKGYQLTKFQLMSSVPGASASVTYVGKVYSTDQTNKVTSTVDIGQTDLLGINYYQDTVAPQYPFSSQIIVDPKIVNQDMFVYITDPDGGTLACNYYIEIKALDLAKDEATVATLKDIRNAGSQ